MTTYFFETITAAQATAFDATTDALVFGNPTSSGSKMTVLYTVIPATPLNVAGLSITITDNADGISKVFSDKAQGLGETHVAIFPDGSNLIVDSNTTGGTFSGTTF